MPAKNTLKQYIPGGFYHIYNRGVDKKEIFLDNQDYKVFLNYLKLYLSPKDKLLDEVTTDYDLIGEERTEKIIEISRLNNFYNKIELISFVLMKNHFHFELRQKDKNDIEIFMRSLITKYVKYFNLKYQRVGPLFQSRYKGILIEKEEYLLHLSRYIHNNPKEILKKNESLVSYPWSSYPAYLGKINITWLKKEYLEGYFKEFKGFGFNSYQRFIEGYKDTDDKYYRDLLIDLD